MKKIKEYIQKHNKRIAICILLFWVILVSANFGKILNLSDLMEEEGSNLTSTNLSESKIGLNLLSIFLEDNGTVQLVIHNPQGSILTSEMKEQIITIINTVTSNPKIGPFLSSKQPYSSLFSDADNLLRSILNLQWISTQASFATIHYIWGGLDFFADSWIDSFNTTSDLEVSTTFAITQTKWYVNLLLDSNNESLYGSTSDTFYTKLGENFLHSVLETTPSTKLDVVQHVKDIIFKNTTFYQEITTDNRILLLLEKISSSFNNTRWEEDEYIYGKITEFLFEVNDTQSVEFIEEVYDNGNIEGYVKAKNKYLLPILKNEISIPSITSEIIETFLKQYTNFENDTTIVDTTIVLFKTSISYFTPEGKELHLEFLSIIDVLQENSGNLELYVTGVNLFVFELSEDYIFQSKKMDIVAIVTITLLLFIFYRSPFLPLIQILVIGVTFGVSRIIFYLIADNIVGLASSSLMMMNVSLIGATTNYCVFLIGDYQYNLKRIKDKKQALLETYRRTAKSIFISSLSLTLGFGALMFSSLTQARGMGIGGAIGFLSSALVSLTFLPSILFLINSNILTKWKIKLPKISAPKLNIDKYVRKAVKNPGKVLIISIILSLTFTGIFFLIPTDYAQLSSAPQYYKTKQGYDAINNYMGVEYTSQIIIIFQTSYVDTFLLENNSLNFESIQLVVNIFEKILEEIDLYRIAGVSHPLGIPYLESLNESSPFLNEEIQILMRNFILPNDSIAVINCGSHYLEGDKNLENQIEQIRTILNAQLLEYDLTGWKTYVTGFSPLMYDSIQGIKQDFGLIFTFVIITITLLLFAFMRNILVSSRVLITILISLGINLGLFSLISFLFLGGSTYWIVPLILFAVLTALGLDFDVLFLGIFMRLYKKTEDIEQSILDAIKQTMKNISIAGVVMAATYMGLMFTSSIHMKQIGLGLGVGILVDVFIIRLFVVPPAIILSVKRMKITKPKVK